MACSSGNGIGSGLGNSGLGEAILNYIVNHHVVSLGRLRCRSPAELSTETMQVCRKGWGGLHGARSGSAYLTVIDPPVECLSSRHVNPT